MINGRDQVHWHRAISSSRLTAARRTSSITCTRPGHPASHKRGVGRCKSSQHRTSAREYSNMPARRQQGLQLTSPSQAASTGSALGEVQLKACGWQISVGWNNSACSASKAESAKLQVPGSVRQYSHLCAQTSAGILWRGLPEQMAPLPAHS